MASDKVRRGVHISSGPGIVAHLDGLTAFAHGDEAELSNLLIRLNALAGEPWQEIVRTLTAEITAVGYDSHPSLACIYVEEDSVAALVFGDTTLSLVIDDNEMTLNGTGSSTWVDVVLHGKIERISGGTAPDNNVVGVLRDGAIPAGGFMLDTEGPIPAAGRWAEEFAAPTEAAPTQEPVVDEAPADDVAIEDEAADIASEESVPEPVLAEDAEDAVPEEDEISGVPVASDPIVDDVEAELPAESREVEAELSTHDVDPLSEEPEWAEPAMEEPPAPEPAVTEPAAAAAATAAVGVAAGAAAVAATAEEAPHASGLFARLDERIHGDDAGFDNSADDLPPPIPSTDTEAVVDPSPAADIVEDAPEVHPVQSEQDDPSMRSMAATIAQTAPQIRGVRCAAGHLTKPGGAPCFTCGARTEVGAPEEVGNRPALGTLTFDDGAALDIDRPAAIGANVPAGYIVSDEPATIVRLDDGAGGIEDVHLEVQLSGWDVNIVDMFTSSGTYTMLDGDRQTRTRLRSGQSVTLQPGMHVEAGERSFSYSVGPNPPAE